MKEWNCYTNVDKLLKLRWPTYEPTTYLLVWWFGGNKKHNCHSIISKDYESAEYCALEFITLNKVEHAVLYKSGVKLNKKDKHYIFRYYVPLAWYNGNRYQLAKRKECFVAPIKISTDETRIWSAEYLIPEECDNCMQIELETNFDRVYGRKKNESL